MARRRKPDELSEDQKLDAEIQKLTAQLVPVCGSEEGVGKALAALNGGKSKADD